MFDRLFNAPENSSFFIFGARGTGKTSWLREKYPNAIYFDLLDSQTEIDLKTDPKNLLLRIPEKYRGPVILDEVQKVPSILNEIHRQIENPKKRGQLQFILTGSSARKLRTKGVNLLAGRALVTHFHPLTPRELGKKFDLLRAIQYGLLPSVWTRKDPKEYLASYVKTYVDLEVKLEGLSRDIPGFFRFLQAASFSQAAPLNISGIASDCGIERRTVSNYFDILTDLMISHRLPIFSKKAKRELLKHDKFYFFDAGIYQTLRPKGPLDLPSEMGGPAFETLVLQTLMAMNQYFSLEVEFSYWHTRNHIEVDLVLYGPNGLIAIEVKSSSRIRQSDFDGLQLFKQDYPMSRTILIYAGDKTYVHGDIEVVAATDFFKQCEKYMVSK